MARSPELSQSGATDTTARQTAESAERAGPSVALLCEGAGVLFRPGRVVEVVASMPVAAKLFLIYTLIIDVLVVVSCFIKHGNDQSTFQRLIIVYVCFHYASAFHSVYTQNEYTLVAALALVLVETLFVTLDWRDTFTGYHHTVPEIVLQWVSCCISAGLSVWVYKSMEGFGWRPYRELGALMDSLAVHSAYRLFTASLSCDVFASVMECTLTWNLVSWDLWLVILNAVFNLAMPLLLYVPLRKSVKHEWITLLGVLVTMYLLGWGAQVTVFVYSILEQANSNENSRLLKDGRFPIGWVLMAATGTAVIVRVLLIFRLYRVVTLAYGKGLLKELGARRSMHRDVYCGTGSGYGTIRSYNSDDTNTRYDFHYRVTNEPGLTHSQSVSALPASTTSLPIEPGTRSLSVSGLQAGSVGAPYGAASAPYGMGLGLGGLGLSPAMSIPGSSGLPSPQPIAKGAMPSASSPHLPMGGSLVGPVPIVTAKSVALKNGGLREKE